MHFQILAYVIMTNYQNNIEPRFYLKVKKQIYACIILNILDIHMCVYKTNWCD